jgi:hypothetical protein
MKMPYAKPVLAKRAVLSAMTAIKESPLVMAC